MWDWRRLWLVADFELRDALRSRLALMVGLLFSGGAALATWVFIRAQQASEEAARKFIASQSQIPPEAVPMDEIRGQAVEGLVNFWTDDPGLRESLLAIEPVGIFFGFSTLLVVPFLVLALSAGAHASDIRSGAARFVLFRADRRTWALGKMLGHVLLLGVGLLVAAGVAGVVALSFQTEITPRLFSDLIVAALRALIYGAAYLAIFSGVSLVAAAPMRARALSLGVLFFCAVGHAAVSSGWFASKLPQLAWLKWAFPGQYKMALWHLSPQPLLGALVGLFLIGAVGFSLGHWIFSRRDA